MRYRTNVIEPKRKRKIEVEPGSSVSLEDSYVETEVENKDPKTNLVKKGKGIGKKSKTVVHQNESVKSKAVTIDLIKGVNEVELFFDDERQIDSGPNKDTSFEGKIKDLEKKQNSSLECDVIPCKTQLFVYGDASYYKYCMVPQCESTSIETPNKLFIFVPSNAEVRKKWLNLARRNDANCLSSISRMYFCEDHFDLPNDMLNYTEYHIMGKVSKVLLKPGCTPSKFECQEDRRKRTCSSTERPFMLKKKRMEIIAESLEENTKKKIWSVWKIQNKLVRKVSKIFHIQAQIFIQSDRMSLNLYVNRKWTNQFKYISHTSSGSKQVRPELKQ
ncbi:uncharacterized protein LOC124542107 [Vanessa cardui]|uniref:uncharacterized protein LOC124542107 n=1 Tax=Vanessa cardui TaxID=171605 RepID=UPI001F14069A|nr:uncharacterized protein LOC124542107 [Vanessa cardui]